MNGNETDSIKMDMLDPANGLNMPELADMTFAMDFLVFTKSAVHTLAAALTETVSRDARAFLRAQLHQGIALHQEITELMIRKKWFHPHDLNEQYKLDNLSADNTVAIAKQKLFPDDTSRKGMFDRTPDKNLGGHQA